MVGLVLLAQPIVDVIFRRGRFAEGDVAKTALAVAFFALGLYAAAGVKIVTQAFYALHDTKTPVLVATFDLAAFWVLCVVLAKPLQHAGVALATSAGFWINFVVLLALLSRRLGSLGGRVVAFALLRLLLASLAMGAVVWLLAHRVPSVIRPGVRAAYGRGSPGRRRPARRPSSRCGAAPAPGSAGAHALRTAEA